jgi:hypothetical protein
MGIEKMLNSFFCAVKETTLITSPTTLYKVIFIVKIMPFRKNQMKILVLRGNFNFQIALFRGITTSWFTKYTWIELCGTLVVEIPLLITSCGYQVAQTLFLIPIHSTWLAYHQLVPYGKSN